MRGSAPTRIMIVAATIVLIATLGACAEKEQTGQNAAPSVAADQSPGDSAPSETSTPKVSSGSLKYAESLGGESQEGKTLYFVVGASVKSEKDAQSKLDKAIPLFGDMQSYFIVQRSDNFEGMTPGWWIIIEAYRNEPSSENVDFGRRAFPDAYVKRATVQTSDPIPVYEDIVPGSS